MYKTGGSAIGLQGDVAWLLSEVTRLAREVDALTAALERERALRAFAIWGLGYTLNRGLGDLALLLPYEDKAFLRALKDRPWVPQEPGPIET